MLTVINSRQVGFFWKGKCSYVKRFITKSMAGPQVRIPQGTLEGRHETADKGSKYACFQGIPYGRPPVGELRFRDPLPAFGWEGVRSAAKDGNVCPQLDVLNKGVFIGDEDCLCLNVYTPNLTTRDPPRPVIVYIHGGAFIKGSGSRATYGPEYLMEKNVVVVTINYRLSALGFLCLHTPEVPGNAGIKDQVLALKWIRDNITWFGGDSRNVTLFGESAGAASVHLITLSPSACGLFHKAILLSGSALCNWAHQADPLPSAIKLAASFGCTETDEVGVLKFLQSVPAFDLIERAMKTLDKEMGKKYIPSEFLPVLERVHSDVEPLIIEDPKEIMKSANFPQTPFIIGCSAKESVFIFDRISYDADRVAEMINDFQYFIPSNLDLVKDTAESLGVAEKIRKFYFGDNPVDGKSIDGAVDLLSDYAFKRAIHETVTLISGFSNSPVYQYQFSYYGNLNKYKKNSQKLNVTKAAHTEENGYIFKRDFLVNEQVFPDDQIVRDRLLQMWTDFAKYGNPTPTKTDVIKTIWEPVQKNKNHYLEIDKEIVLGLDPNETAMKFWHELGNNIS